MQKALRHLVIYEFISGGGLYPKPLPHRLQQEGELMLHALVQDALELADFEIAILRDPRLMPLNVKTFKNWETALEWGDVFLIVAPETANCLLHLHQQVLKAGKQLWGCGLESVELCAYKSLSAQRLALHQIPHIPCYFFQQKLPPTVQRWVVKPNDGAGCHQTFLATRWQLDEVTSKVPHPILQPYVTGQTLSLCVLYAQHTCRVVAVNQQHIRVQHAQFSYHGSRVNAFPYGLPQAQLLAAQIAQAFPDLLGWVGIDLIAHDETWVVTEINPRITTSYAGLHHSLHYNPLHLLQRAWQGEDISQIPLASQSIEIIV